MPFLEKFLKHPELHFNKWQTGSDKHNVYRVTISKNGQAIHCLISRYVYDILVCGTCCIPVIHSKWQKMSIFQIMNLIGQMFIICYIFIQNYVGYKDPRVSV